MAGVSSLLLGDAALRLVSGVGRGCFRSFHVGLLTVRFLLPRSRGLGRLFWQVHAPSRDSQGQEKIRKGTERGLSPLTAWLQTPTLSGPRWYFQSQSRHHMDPIRPSKCRALAGALGFPGWGGGGSHLLGITRAFLCHWILRPRLDKGSGPSTATSRSPG